MAFSRLEPFGSEARFVGHAITAATIANIYRKKGSAPYDVEDFMPALRKKKKQQSVEEMLQIAQMYTIGLGGQDLREKDD